MSPNCTKHVVGSVCRTELETESTPRSTSRPGRRGFTLVELLVVITIIGILIGLLAPVVAIALARAKEAAIGTEIGQLDSALKAYKEKYGSYPPSDLSNVAALTQHLARAFPRCNATSEAQAVASFNMTTPAQCLTFFLNGYSSDVEHPVSGLQSNPASQMAAFYPFDKSRFTNPDGSKWNGTSVPIYSPSATPGVPYVYFAAQSYSAHYQATTAPGVATGTGQGYCRPYAIDNPPSGATGANLYCNPSSFQIISAGLDSDYGGAATAAPIYYPSGLNSQPGDKDNLTNFSQKNLGDAAQQ
jgi:prepilin-type N-terminal cleavage/methylation domain-containing protein